MKSQIPTIFVFLLAIGLFSMSHTSVYGQEVKEYNDDSFDLIFEYPEEWDDSLDEEKSNVLNDNFRSVSFNILGENKLTLYTKDTDSSITNLNQLLLDNLNLFTSKGNMAIKFIDINQDSLFAGLPAIMIVHDQRLLLGNNPNITTLLTFVALSDDGQKTYGLTYEMDKMNFDKYLPIVNKIINSLKIE